MIAQQISEMKDSLSPLHLSEDSTLITSSIADYFRFYSLPSATYTNINYQLGYIDTPKFRLCTQLWQPSTPIGTIFIVHGYFDHTGLYSHIIRFFLEQSYAVFSFDLPGHGLSSGERASIDNFSDYSSALEHCLAWAKGKLTAPWLLFGQSTGAAIITNSLLANNIHSNFPITRAILCAPLVRITHWHTIRFFYYLISPFRKTIKRKRTKNSHDESFLSLLAQDPLQPDVISLRWLNALYQWNRIIKKIRTTINVPSFIIQGESDHTVDWHYNLSFLKARCVPAEIIRLPEAQHHLVNESEHIRQHYLNALKMWLNT